MNLVELFTRSPVPRSYRTGLMLLLVPLGFGCQGVVSDALESADSGNPGIIANPSTGGGGMASRPGSGTGSATGSIPDGGVDLGNAATGGAGVPPPSSSGGQLGTEPPTVARGLPCAVDAVLRPCQFCHGAAPLVGVPMALVTHADLLAPSKTDATMKTAQMVVKRMLDTMKPMPPPPIPGATPNQIQTMNDWIGAGYPTGSCAPAGGSGGTGGGANVDGGTNTGSGGTAGGANVDGGAGSTAGTIPCAVETVLRTRCTTCHGATLLGGAPMSLLTYAQLRAPSPLYIGQTTAERAMARMQATTLPMPPAPGTRVPATDVTVLGNWIAGGYPSGASCSSGAGGAGGASGADPLVRPAVCTSNVRWTRGNSGSSSMNPGRACITCHAGNAGPDFKIAGTLFPTGHEPDLCNGVNGTSGARVVIVDAANRTITLTPNGAGNFTYSGTLTTPFRAKVTYQGRERIMATAQTLGDCNACHTQNGANMAPGRITLP